MLTVIHTNHSDSVVSCQARKTKKPLPVGSAMRFSEASPDDNSFQKLPSNYILFSLKGESSTSKKSDSFFPYLSIRFARERL